MYYEEKRLAISLAKRAGRMMKENFKLGMKSWSKSDETMVTNTDIVINQMVIEAIKEKFPEHDILSEEASDTAKKSSKVWVCDPLDGTLMFMHGIPNCVFSLAFLEDGKPVFGVIYDPFTKRMFSAEIGKGAFLNGEKIRVSIKAELKYAPIGICCWKERGAMMSLTKAYKNLIDDNAADVFDIGSIAYLGTLVAAGEFSASIHPATSPHDSAALKVIVEEAGGTVTNLFGNEQRYDGKINGCIISNGLIHDKLVRIVKKSIDESVY
jgi:myo-inositol-1(or 4)-monophosphatase